jgi:hypothetical protein
MRHPAPQLPEQSQGKDQAPPPSAIPNRVRQSAHAAVRSWRRIHAQRRRE